MCGRDNDLPAFGGGPLTRTGAITRAGSGGRVSVGVAMTRVTRGCMGGTNRPEFVGPRGACQPELSTRLCFRRKARWTHAGEGGRVTLGPSGFVSRQRPVVSRALPTMTTL
ncbi:hypothetical protein E2C01_031390 [Portunus trituberculatus]|uniref:Uncharacterized protein n=1 Tax=Portunus trituberculatus TaxID=210409 RepID=A0A5B7EXH5_PORTR|nr:hypothetical protein [Portunus trituberculatus]